MSPKKETNGIMYKKWMKEGGGFMVEEKLGKEELLEKYKCEVESLSRYIPWFESKTVGMVSHMYRNEGTDSTFSFPVYDSTLLSFVNEAGMSSFMDRNYQYIYTRYHIRSHEDEWRAIEKADIMTMDVIGGILSKYILGGVTKATLWKEGVQYEIFLRCLKKAKEIVEFWDKPLPESKELLFAGNDQSRQRGEM